MSVETLATALEAAARPEPISGTVACRTAQESYRDARADFKRFQNLVYATGCLVVLFLIAGVVLVAAGADTRAAGIVSFVGSAVTGAGMKFVLGERNNTREEKQRAEALVRDYCAERASDMIRRLERGEAVTVD